jgi:hypothetical protein
MSTNFATFGVEVVGNFFYQPHVYASVKRIFSIVLLIIITLQFNASLLIGGAYSLFQRQIAEKYCEFYLEDRLCNGQCFVRKIIIKTEQQEPKQTTPQIRVLELSPAITSDILSLASVCAAKKQHTTPFLESSPLLGFKNSIFRPPIA